MEYRVVNVGSHKVRYCEEGRGRALVLVHGFCLSSEIFELVFSQLSRQYRVIVVDLPGHGGSLPIPGTQNLGETAIWLNRFLGQIGVEEFVLVGHSLGGYIAAAFTERYPEKVKGLGMFHSLTNADSPQKQATRNRVIDFVESHGVQSYLLTFIPELLASGHRHIVDRTTRLALKTRKEAVMAYSAAMRDRKNRTPYISGLAIPVMYILGDRDFFIPASTGREEAVNCKEGTLFMMENVGHMGMYESPRESLQAITKLMGLVTDWSMEATV